METMGRAFVFLIKKPRAVRREGMSEGASD